MEDRFRFRAWNKIKQIYDYDIQECQKIPLHNSNKEKCFACFQSYLKNQDILEIEQCTGLRDKNGKMICEGDIVYLHVNGEDDPYVGHVIYRKAAFKYLTGNIEMNMGDCTNMEIVGNIHENSNLLKNNQC